MLCHVDDLISRRFFIKFTDMLQGKFWKMGCCINYFVFCWPEGYVDALIAGKANDLAEAVSCKGTNLKRFN